MWEEAVRSERVWRVRSVRGETCWKKIGCKEESQSVVSEVRDLHRTLGWVERTRGETTDLTSSTNDGLLHRLQAVDSTIEVALDEIDLEDNKIEV